MIYKIIVDKQSRTNPSSEKKEYTIDIEELRVKGNIYDSLVITKDEDYVMRRLSLSEYQVLTVLEEPIKEPLEDLNIELFEGDNYIYLVDMVGNKFYAEYIVKNDFTDTYVTTNEMNSAITQSAENIELSVNKRLEAYSTTEEMNSAINLKADSITSSVNKKFESYDTSEEVNSKIDQKANEITSSVSSTYETKNGTDTKINTAKAEIKLTTDSISSTVNTKVGKDEVGTEIQQNYESVKIAWNKISEFIQFINSQLQIKDNNKKLLMALDKLGMHFYKSTGTELGDIGIQDTDVIAFAVMNEQGSMAWGIKYTYNGKTDFYPVFSFNGKMVTESGSSSGYGFKGFFDFEAPVRLFEHPIYLATEGEAYIEGNTLGGISIVVPGMNNGVGFAIDDGDGNSLLYINKDIFQILTNSVSIGTVSGQELLEIGTNNGGSYSFDFKNNLITNADNIVYTNGNTVDYLSSGSNYLFVSNKDGTYFSLYANSSDKRLKKNIKNARTKALDKIRKIKHKEFDWKDGSGHQEIGYIAQEIKEIDETFVKTLKFKTKDGKENEDWQINTLSILATATKAIQEQQEQIEKLKIRIEKLEEELNGNN